MTNLNEHPFSPASVARESGEPDLSDRAWFKWAAEVERLLGHDLDGDDTNGEGCGYSIDEANNAWADGKSAHAYVAIVTSRDRYRPAQPS